MRASFCSNKKKSSLFLVIVSSVLTLALIFAACAVYLGSYYHADTVAMEAFLPQETQWTEEDGNIVFEPENATRGVIFYPGGKVEHTAYVPLMHALSQKGILCVLVKMPFNLAVFDKNAADGIQESYPQITDWYIGGHSLGGSMAASYLAKHKDTYKGLVLLGSYSISNLSKTELRALSIYGSEDKVLNAEKYKDYKGKLPAAFTEVVIQGGCHAFFGMYGPQKGDGTPTITNEEQINITAETIANFINQ